MRSFPLPVRVAAGLAATAVQQARQLPSYLVGLPVTLASQALQVSMRVQQQVTELAIKGDEALTGLQAYEEKPSWATFDEDEPTLAPPSPFDRVAAESPEEAVREEIAPEEIAEEPPSVPSQPSVLPDYDQLTLAQLRGKLRGFSEADLVQLLEHERAHGQRPEFLQMLSNRLERTRPGR